MKTIAEALTVLCLLVLTISCEHKEIVCPAPEGIKIVFEWNKASGAEVEGMTLYFYPLKGNAGIWRFDIAGREGGEVSIPCGTYKLIAFNNDLPGVKTGGFDSAATLCASAGNLIMGDESEVYSSTGMLYRGKIDLLEVTPCGVRYVTDTGATKDCSHRTVRCRPDSLATSYTVKLVGLRGSGRIKSIKGALHGVKTSVFLESGRTSGKTASLAFEMTDKRPGGILTGRGCAFAPPEQAASRYSVTLLTTLTDGKTIQKEIGIKPENLNILSRHNVLITIAGTDIGEDTPSGDIGGIGADVEGWETIEINIGTSYRQPLKPR